jgi:probable phosphoglycerate mutase
MEEMEEEVEKNTEILGIRILLIRHGETDFNLTHHFQGRIDIPLNKEGENQAQALALALKDESLTAIYSSPLIRAMETARSIKAFHPSAPLFKEEGLSEMDLGEFDGMQAPGILQNLADQTVKSKNAWRGKSSGGPD